MKRNAILFQEQYPLIAFLFEHIDISIFIVMILLEM